MSDPRSEPASEAKPKTKSMDEIVALAKRRGFIYQASEIYGGFNGFWDYGPLGAQLKKNLRDAWWTDVVLIPCGGRRGPGGQPVRIVPLDTCIIQHPRVWEASGHVGGFADPMQTCRQCKKHLRADHVPGLWEEAGWRKTALEVFAEMRRRSDPRLSVQLEKWAGGKGKKLAPGLALVRNPAEWLKTRAERVDAGDLEAEQILWHAAEPSPGAFTADKEADLHKPRREPDWHPICPHCGGDLTEPRMFNLMFETHAGAVRDEENKAYLRPETAQGIFVQFRNVTDTTRVKVPFGIAQTGKAFRNEVTPRNFTFRSREFEQMEIEFFCEPGQARDWYEFWRRERLQWWQDVGLAGDNLRLREQGRDELAHYAKDGAGTSDIEYRFPFTDPGFGELEGVAHRCDFDLRQHQQFSGAKLDYFDAERGDPGPNGQPKGERYVPHVIEPSAGLDRGVLALLCEAFTPDPERPSGVVMRFHPRLAPIKAAVFPLVNKDGMPEIAERLALELTRRFAPLGGTVESDPKQTIGKRYARMDEAGCPFCFTVDGETLQNQTVTVRARDSMQQERIGIDQVAGWLAERLGSSAP
jgi:glycyl-tRNA synthetase